MSDQSVAAGFDDLPTVDRDGWPFDEAPRASAGEASAKEPPDGGWPRISIVIPSFGQGAFLEETLRSILLQGYPNLELLVFDGGSRDGTVEILERYDPWIDHWTSGPDGGQSDAINQGFARAEGEIITFFGSDDVYEPGAFFDVARRFRAQRDIGTEVGAVIGAFRFLDEHSRRLDPCHLPRLPGPGPQDLTLLEPTLWRLHQVATFYTRAALDDVGRHVREDLHYTMDRELLFRVARRYPIARSDEVYAGFRLHGGSKSVASILPMSREMGQLHLDFGSANDIASIRRRRMRLARHHWARGGLKLARSGVGLRRAVPALFQAARHRPDFVLRGSYVSAWLSVLGLEGAIRRLLGRGRT